MNVETFKYDNRIVRAFAIATVIWGIVGMLVGILAAVQLFYPEANLNFQFITFGRIRPLHTNAVIFAFVGNGYTILSDGNRNVLPVPLNTEGYDLINFGSTDASGTTQISLGGGARSRLVKNVDIGVAYEVGVGNSVGIFQSRITADLIWRF